MGAGVSLSFTEVTTFLEQVKNNRMNRPCKVFNTRKIYQTGSRSTSPAMRPASQVSPISSASLMYRNKLIRGPVAVILAVDLALSHTRQADETNDTTFMAMIKEKGATK